MLRLIVFILIFALFLAFIILNLENRCDISIGFTTFRDIPVFLTALFSFTFGMLFAVPLVSSLGKGRKKEPKSDSSGKFNKKPKAGLSSEEEIKKDAGSYGID